MNTKKMISLALALMLVLTMLPVTAFAAAPSLKITNSKGEETDTFVIGDPIFVTAESDDSDWVAMYSEGQADGSSYWFWYYVNGTASKYGKNWSWTNGETYNIYDTVCYKQDYEGDYLAAGKYEIRLENNPTVTKTITLVAPESTEPSMTVESTEVVAGEPIKITATSFSDYAWVGLYSGHVETVPGTSLYNYMVNGHNGLTMETTVYTPGDYTLLLLADWDGTVVDKVIHLTVTEADAPIVPLATDKTEYKYGEPIMVTTNYAGAGAWVGLYKKGESYNPDAGGSYSIFWYYLSEQSNPVDIRMTRNENGRSGEFVAGEYTVVLFQDGGYTPYTTVDIVITKEAVSTETVAATCEKDGKTIVTYSDGTTEETIIPKLGHDYGDWSYNAGNRQHSKTCANDPAHIVTENCTFDEGVVKKEATETENGIMLYTCTVCGGTYEDVITTKTVVSEVVTKEATCEEAGELLVTYDDGSTTTKVIPPKGHAYGEWVHDAENHTHTKTCANDPKHVITGDCEYEDGTWNSGKLTKVCTECEGEYEVTVLSTDKTVYAWSDRILVTVDTSAYGSAAKDWVGIFRKGEVPGSDVISYYWYYLGDMADNRNVDLYSYNAQIREGDPFTVGEYSIILLADNGYDVITSIDITVTEDPVEHEHSYENGICVDEACGAYQPAELNDDNVYEIGNAGQLLWFAELVNSNADELMVNKAVKVDAKLTADIDMTGLPWIPIGLYDLANKSYGFGGTFDGCGHTVSGIDYTVTSTSDYTYAGFFGAVYNATIRNLLVQGSFTAVYAGTSINPTARAGGIVAYADGGTQEYTIIENCGFVGSLSAEGKNMTQVGGIAGLCQAVLKNCWSAATVESNDATHQRLGGLVGVDSKGTYENCYYDSTLCDLSACYEGDLSGVTAKTTAQFASGEVAYLLNGSTSEGDLVWFQALGTDAYPVFEGETVYRVKNCDCVTDIYSNSNEPKPHNFSANGFCTVCDAYQPAELNDDNVYEIGNAGQLLWFATHVNSGKVSIGGKLVADLDFTDIEYIPIGNRYNGYSGTFDGCGHTVSGIDYTVTSTSDFTYAGFFGRGYNATIRNLMVQGSFTAVYAGTSINPTAYAGGIVAFADGGTQEYPPYTIIENCGFVGSLSAEGKNMTQVGGIAGYCKAVLKNCWSAATVESNDATYQRLGGLVGADSQGTYENCYYDSTLCDLSACYKGDLSGVTAKTTAQFASGEVAYLLGEPFGQNIDNGGENEGHPVFSDAAVYYGYASCADDAGIGYTNNSAVSDTKPEHTFSANGFCTVCDAYQPAELNDDDVYEIGNAGQLYWFAQQVNGGNWYINGKLTADIVVNEKVLENGALVSDTSALRGWTPIESFDGTLDGADHTISGLYCSMPEEDDVGLIGTLFGTVQNVTIADSYFRGNDYVGSVAGYVPEGSVVKCGNTGTVTGNMNVGGVVGDMPGTWMTNCYNTGTVTGTENVGGVVGDMPGGWMANCYNTGTVTGTEYVGGLVGYLPGSSMANCYNTGIVTGTEYVGGVVGYMPRSLVVNCYYLDAASGTEAKTAEQFASGEVAWLLSQGGTVRVAVGEDENYNVIYEERFISGDCWGQTIGTDAYPVLEGETVYRGYLTCAEDAEMGYSNDPAVPTTKPEHTPDEAVRENEKAATCTAEGSYDEVVYCSVCEEELSRKTVTVDALGHAYGAAEYTWSQDGKTCTAKRTCGNDAAHVETATATVTSEVTKDPTCEAKGETTYTATFTEDWAETQTKTIADVDVVDHTPAEAVRENEKAATCTETGSYDEVVYCSVCGDEMSRETVTVEKLAHTPGEAVRENEKAATCDKAGSYDEVVYCSVCGEELSRKTVTVDALGHKDADKDHKCDVCGKVLSECVDEDKDYKCDICGKDLEKPEDPSDPVEEDEVIRLAGSHRWETALKVADEMKANLGVEKFNAIIIASGNDFADALAGSYLSTVKNAPILLGWGKGGKFEYLDTDNIEYIKANLAEGGTVYILGGKNAVPELYENELKGYNVKRLGGANRFETNLLILAEAGVADGSEILVCTSTNFADSLSASATAKPILLVFNEYGKLYGKQPEFLAGLKNCTFTVIGGENAVSADLAKAIEAYGKVERLAGANRFETSVMVAQKYFKDVDTAVLAYAWNYPDGLCGGSLAYSLKAPLILTMTKYEAKAVEYAKSAGIETGLVLGGDTLISDEAVRSIFAMDAADEIIEK